MTIRARWLWSLCVASVWFANPTAARAGARGIRDGGGFFGKQDVVENITAQIEDIHRRYGADLLIETFSAPPEGRAAADVKHLRNKKFSLWAEERALAADVRGVYILICNAPRQVDVYVSDDYQAIFDERTGSRLHRTLSRKIYRKWPDALQETVDLVRDRLASKEAEAKRGGWLWIVGVIAGILGLWLVIALVRRFLGGKTVAPPNAVSSSALAGQSLYQALSAHDSPPPPPAPAEAEPATLPYPHPAPQSQSEGTVAAPKS